jgi:type VI secretion system (T6SS) effector TldE1-like protein
MTFETAMAGRSPPRRRIGWSDKVALLCGALACACGAAAWINESFSFTSPVASPIAHELLSFEERFAQVDVPQSLRGRTLQPLDRSALSALETKVQDAKGQLAQKLQLGEWRGALLEEPQQPSASAVPLPRSRPTSADFTVAVVADTTPRPEAPAKSDRTWMQKLSDILPGRLTLASLTPGDGLFRSHPDLQSLGYDSQTAVYDISAHAVYLPNGLTLEAHSGIGMLKDNPETVQARNAGATPPAVYDLRPREKLFHGVRALRMIPADGSDTLGRAGLLVHSFMLGPDGDSNGCVSIRDYVRFRKAYDDGEINRLVVVPAMTTAPATAARTTSQS